MYKLINKVRNKVLLIIALKELKHKKNNNIYRRILTNTYYKKFNKYIAKKNGGFKGIN